MWAAISLTGKTALVYIPRNLTAQRYCGEILQPHVLPLMQQNGARFQHDNARPHTARITTALLTNSNVAVLPWPSKSPDLNPIELHCTFKVQGHYSSISRMSTTGVNNSLTAPAH
jgi:hypothetical protein